MSNPSNTTIARNAQVLPVQGRLRASAQAAACALHRLWRAYWFYRGQQATAMILQSLNDRTLADIGLRRSEIESAVSGTPSDRLRPYDPDWRAITRF